MVDSRLTLTIAEVAEQLSISKPLAYNLAASEGFPAIRISERRIVVPTKAFEKWLEDQAGNNNSPRSYA